MSYPLLSGRTPVVYHTIPTDLSHLLTIPSRENIMAYLSHIPAKLFPEFVKDILLKIEKHTLVDVVDGPGDEKLDILTITSDGKRCLTQCKLTGNLYSKYNGDDLDLLVSACMRKQCQKALLITNGELTTQAKRYIIDNEYCKDWPLEQKLDVDYLNGTRIWERIQSNTDILNKWFSGLGQVHGLRNFKFDISVQKLPYEPAKNDEDVIGDLINLLKGKSIIKEVEEDISFTAEIDDDFRLYLKRWIQFPNNLDINYLSPEEDPNYNNKPMDCLTVEVNIENKSTYAPNAIRKKIILYLLENCLEDLPNERWWQIVSSRSTSFVFIHDINEPRQITLDTAETFVKAKGSKLCSELDFCSLSGTEFIVSHNEEEKGYYTHSKYGCHILQYFTQKVEPFDEFNHKGCQHCQWEELKNFTFRVVPNINTRIIYHLTNFLPIDWHSFQIDKTTLAWCYPDTTDSSEVAAVEKEIRLLGLQLMTIKPEDIPHVLENINMAPSEYIIHNNLDQLRFPIALKDRWLMISKSFPLSKKVGIDWFRSLAQYKIDYEKQFGIHSTSEEDLYTCKNFELPYILSDVKNIRGSRMLDINVWDSPIWVTMRFKQEKIISSRDIALQSAEEFEKIFTEIRSKFS